jgi:tRNA nucleotidyltransferase (CCA-adding enzyme)
MQFALSQGQAAIVKGLIERGLCVWVVGGALRDTLLGKAPTDIDFAHNGTQQDVKEVAEAIGMSIADDDSAWNHGIVRVGDGQTRSLIDFAMLRTDVNCDGRHADVAFTKDINEDLARRDFTINAMAARINHDGATGPLIDPFGGRRDLQDHVIRFVGDASSRIKEDYLRILRACRFTALGPDWKISTDGLGASTKHAIDVMRCSKERIHDELVKGLMYPKPSNLFRSMQSIGLLDLVFPDLARGVGCGQNVHHAEPVFDHLLRCLDASVELTDDPMLRLATLTHDIAKPHTKKIINGDATFYKHEVVGASIMYNWMKTYKFSRKECEYVSKMVRHHQWRFEDDTTDKTIRHWLQEVGKEEWRDLITLRMADRMGNLKKKDKPVVTQKMKELVDRVEGMIKAGVPIFKEDLAINGQDLIELGIKPGPIFKDIFSNILGIVITNPEKNTKDWLSKYVTKNYIQKKEKAATAIAGGNEGTGNASEGTPDGSAG